MSNDQNPVSCVLLSVHLVRIITFFNITPPKLWQIHIIFRPCRYLVSGLDFRLSVSPNLLTEAFIFGPLKQILGEAVKRSSTSCKCRCGVIAVCPDPDIVDIIWEKMERPRPSSLRMRECADAPATEAMGNN